MEREVFEKELDDLGLLRRNAEQTTSSLQHFGGSLPRASVVFPSGESLLYLGGPDGIGEEFYDPNNSGNPLLDLDIEYRKRKLSEHFTAGEFAKSGGVPFYKARIDPKLVTCLEQLRKFIKKPITILDGYYSYKYLQDYLRKRNITKIPNSPHLSGQGAKIMSKEVDAFTLAKASIYVFFGPSYENFQVGLGEQSMAIYVGQTERKITTYIQDNILRDRRLKQLRDYKVLLHEIPARISEGLYDTSDSGESTRTKKAMHDFVHWAIHEHGIFDEALITEALFYRTALIQGRRASISAPDPLLPLLGAGLLDMRNSVDSTAFHEILNTYVRPALHKPAAPLEQRGGEPGKVAGPFADEPPMPDRPYVDITGRYEIIYSTDNNPVLGKVMGVNQAGNHVEIVMSSVLNAKANKNMKRSLEKLNGDLQKDGSFNLISREDRSVVFRLVPKGRFVDTSQKVYELQLEWQAKNGLKYESFTLTNDSPVLWRRAFRSFKDPEFVESNEWYPLLSSQMRYLSDFFGTSPYSSTDKVFDFLSKFYGDPPGFAEYSVEKWQGKVSSEFNDELSAYVGNATKGIHPSDYLRARHYIRILLSRKFWRRRSDDASLSYLTHMYEMVSRMQNNWRKSALVKYHISQIRQFIVGPEWEQELNTYKITIQKLGISASAIGGVGAYGGTITIEKTRGQKWNIDRTKYPDGKVKFYFIMGGGGLGEGFGIHNLTYTGEATPTPDLWRPEHFPGDITMQWAEGSGVVLAAGPDVGRAALQIYGSEGFKPLTVSFNAHKVGAQLPNVESDETRVKQGKRKLTITGYDVQAFIAYGRIIRKGGQITLDDPAPSTLTSEVDYVSEGAFHFKIDSSKLEDSARQSLRVMCARELPALMSSSCKLEVRGYADGTGPKNKPADYNQKLSLARARNTKQAIKDILGTKLNIPEARFVAKGLGWVEAIEHGEEGKSNLDRRRVDILLNDRLVWRLYQGNW